MLNNIIDNLPLRTTNRYLSKGLGLFSLALGLSEIIAPKFLARKLGLRGQHSIVRGYGLREMLNGALILLAKNPMPWLWTRVAGDAVDLATLKTGKATTDATKRNLMIAVAAVAGVTLLDILSAGIASRKK